MDKPSVSHMEGLSVDREQQDMSIHHNTLYGFIQGGVGQGQRLWRQS